LLLGVTLTGAAVAAVLAGAGTVTSAAVKIGEGFIREVKGMMKPGTSLLFVLDREGDSDAILRALRGLGGTVLKSNVDAARARLIQSALAAASAQSPKPGS